MRHLGRLPRLGSVLALGRGEGHGRAGSACVATTSAVKPRAKIEGKVVENGGRTENMGISMVLRCFIYLKIDVFFVPEKMATGIHTFSLDVSLIEPFFPGHNPLYQR